MRLEISKRYSYSFHPIITNYPGSVGTLAITFLADLLKKYILRFDMILKWEPVGNSKK